MKKIIFIFLFIFNCSTQINSQQAQYGFYGNFYTGVLGNGEQRDYSKFSGLGLSLWHHYPNCWSNIDFGWADLLPENTDVLTANLSTMGLVVLPVYEKNALTQYNYRTISDRVKLDKLCYGQRSEYQAEKKSLCDSYYDFYSFDYSVDNNLWARDIIDNDPNHGEGQYVKHCWPMPELEAGNPVIILKDLNANREQVNITGWTHPYEIDQYHTFHFKPRMRININESLSHNLDLSI